MAQPPPIAVVTGSSSGIGKAIALGLAADGAQLVIHARENRSGAEDVAAAIRKTGSDAHVLLCDLADAAARADFVERAWQWQGRVDYWINNAGVDVLTGPAAGWSFAQKLEALLRVDVAATIDLARNVGRA